MEDLFNFDSEFLITHREIATPAKKASKNEVIGSGLTEKTESACEKAAESDAKTSPIKNSFVKAKNATGKFGSIADVAKGAI
jgi:hypothetical protein